MAGLGRPACVESKLAQKMLSDSEYALDLTPYEVDSVCGIRTLGFVGASVRTLAYTLHLHRLARNRDGIYRGLLLELLIEILRVMPPSVYVVTVVCIYKLFMYLYNSIE